MRSTVVLVSLIYLTTGQEGVHCGAFKTGPYNLKLIRHELCEDQETGADPQDYDIVNKSTHKAFLQGNVTLPFDYDDNLQTQLNFSKLGSRGWGQNAYKLKFVHFCADFLRMYPKLFEFIFKSWGIEKPSCPIQAGNYSLDMDTDLPSLSKLPYLPYGIYRIHQDLFLGNPPVRVACNVWYVTCSERTG